MLLGLEKAEGLTGRAWKDWARSLTASPEHVCGELSAKDCPHPRVQSLVADALGSTCGTGLRVGTSLQREWRGLMKNCLCLSGLPCEQAQQPSAGTWGWPV